MRPVMFIETLSKPQGRCQDKPLQGLSCAPLYATVPPLFPHYILLLVGQGFSIALCNPVSPD